MCQCSTVPILYSWFTVPGAVNVPMFYSWFDVPGAQGQYSWFTVPCPGQKRIGDGLCLATGRVDGFGATLVFR